MAMSQEQYRARIARDDHKCPFCGGGHISGSEVTIERSQAHQEVTCQDCGAVWSDAYALTGYAFTEVPDAEDLEEGVSELPEDPPAPRTMHFAVSGRIPGDDEDTTLTFEMAHDADRLDATEAFELAIYAMASSKLDPTDVGREHGQSVFVNSVLKSTAPLVEL